MDVMGFEVNAVFYDDVNFPRGFNKSGEFSVSEAKALSDYGQAMKALFDGSRKPVTDDEIHFVQVCTSECEASNTLERAWIKYQNKISDSISLTSPFGSSRPVIEDSGAISSPTIDADEL